MKNPSEDVLQAFTKAFKRVSKGFCKAVERLFKRHLWDLEVAFQSIQTVFQGLSNALGPLKDLFKDL